MKLQMKLRTRLFLGFSALMTVALLGLLLALVSVMQMAKSQEQLIRDNFSIIEINQQLRQTLGNHLIVMLTDDNRSEALAPLRQSFQQTLERGIAEANDDVDRQAFRAVASAYAAFLQQIEASRHQNLTLLEDNPLSQSFNKVRGLMTDMQGAAYDKIRDTELRSRD
ncbi:TPA: KinB sensor domain-containing domain, partial [Klebsiella pneumoniae]